MSKKREAVHCKEERGTVVWMLEEGVSAYCAEASDPSK